MQTQPCPKCGAALTPGSFCPKDGARAEGKSFGVGYELDKYTVEEQIGEGGMGEVWRGRHAVVGKKVAIKLLNAKFIANQEIMLRFRREAQSVNEIRNKHLVDIFDFGELPDGRPYFVMEHLEGKSLAAYIRQGPLAFAELSSIFEQLCRAMQAAHDRGIVHRDLKPDNIFLVLEEGAPPFVKVLDFGIAKLADTEESKGSITRTGAVFGTPAYMSPEQCEGTKTVDHRSDIYSMGIILCEMICGRTPFAEPGESTGVIMAKHIMTPAPPPSALVANRRLPPSIDAIVLRALSKDPSARPQRAIDFYKEFAAASAGVQNEATPAAKPVHLPDTAKTTTGDYFAGARTKHPAPNPNRTRNLIIGAALSIFVGSLAAYLIASQPEESPPTPAATPTLATPAPQPASIPDKPKVVRLSVSASVASTVLMQNVFLGETPLSIDVPYGEEEVTLRIQSEGHEPKELSFTPKSDFTTSVELKALSKTAAKKAAPATTKPPKKKNTGLLFNDD